MGEVICYVAICSSEGASEGLEILWIKCSSHFIIGGNHEATFWRVLDAVHITFSTQTHSQ